MPAAFRRRRSELSAHAVTTWLRARRSVRDLDERFADRLRQQLAGATVLLVAVTTVVGVAAVLGHPRSIAYHPVAATAAPPPHVLPPVAPTAAPTPAAPQPTPQPAPPTPAPAAVVPAYTSGALPVGKGMWIWQPDQVEGGNVDAMVQKALATGLTHLYVRTGSSVDGFNGGPFLDAILPAAHHAGIRVYGWDFPYLTDVGVDVQRALAAIAYTTPDGQRIDGFSPDIETASEGVNLSADNAGAYVDGLRTAVGAGYPLIATVPNPTPVVQAFYPYAQVLAPMDAVAPMVYWLNRQPDTDVANAVDFLAPFGKPVVPIGQAYDGGPEGGRPGPPTPDEIQRFLATADAHGAAGVSFWSWQHADQSIWDTIAAAPQFTLQPVAVADLAPGQVRTVQVLLRSLGFGAVPSGQWDAATTAALAAFQQAWGLPPTGVLDDATRAALLRPLPPPLAMLQPGQGSY